MQISAHTSKFMNSSMKRNVSNISNIENYYETKLMNK